MSNLIHLGTDYGGWTIPEGYLTKGSVCYCAGAGEDISFEVELINKYGCDVHVFDPTPKAEKHFINIERLVREKQPVPINNSNECYNIDESVTEKIHFYPIGLAGQTGFRKFYPPKKEHHASYSSENLQKTNTYITLSCEAVSELAERLEHYHNIDLLKLDIEGSEFGVIDDILRNNIDCKVLCVEFHKNAGNPLHYIGKLKEYGYKWVYADNDFNYTFVLQQ